jgi:CTP synthase (UTP-ammonia lyase)
LQQEVITGYFNCAYGVNPAYTEKLNQYPFVFTAFSESGAVRGVELKGHRFFVGTLFQPPLESTPEVPNPLILRFFELCATPIAVGTAAANR